jgi:hypothetical protein
MKILKVEELNHNQKLTTDFINSIQYLVESDSHESNYKKVQNKIVSDLKLNSRLIGTFGTGIGAFYPVVNSLMVNMGSNIELTDETIVLATICAITIIFLEEKKFKEDEELMTKDSKSMLEELKMKGVGNGIIKKLVKALKSTYSIFLIITKHIGAVVNGFTDMFAYTSMLIPVMNAINVIIGKYEFTPDTLIQNFVGLAIGVTTIAAKHSIIDIFNKVKDKLNISKKEIIKDIEENELDNLDLTKAKEIKNDLV